MFKKTLFNTSFYVRKAPEGESGGEGGGAGGSGSGNAGTESPPSSASTPTGGINQPAFDHGPSGEQFSPPDVNSRVSEIMKGPGDRRLTAAELNDMLNFNVPFAKSEEKKEEKKPGTEAAPAPAAAAPAITPKPGETATVPPAPAALTPEAIAAAAVAAVKAAQPTPAAETPKPEVAKPFYGNREQGAMRDAIQVNPELKAAIFGDKPEVAAQAIDIMVNGIMNQMMADSGQLMGMMYQKIINDVRGIIPQQITHQTESRDNTQRFYTKYAELNVPTIKPLIEAVAVAMRKAEPNSNPGSDDFLNRLGLGVHAAFKKEFGFDLPRKGGTTMAPAPGATARSEPFVANGGARPPAAANGHDKSADILALLI